MKTAARLLLIASIFSLFPFTASAEEATKPNIVVLATGGTIAGAAKSPTDIGYKPGVVAVDVLLDSVPQLAQLATIEGEQFASIASQDMTDALWVRLAIRVNQLLAAPDVDGVVITHGTDTLEETAYFLHLVCRSGEPVVITAAMRPSTSLSADGPLNLFNAVAVAADPNARDRGVLVVINDDIHSAREVTKSHTTDPDSFDSDESGLIGATLFGQQEFFRSPFNIHTSKSRFAVTRDTTLPRVDIIYAHEAMSPDLIDAAAANGAKGIVIAGVGDGNMNAGSLEAVKRVRAKGVVVVRSTRVGGGFVRRNVEVNDDEIGTVASMDLNPQKARVLLKLALLETRDVKTIQQWFDAY